MAMRQRKTKDKGAKAGRVVWRISAAAPLGEYVIADDHSQRRDAIETASLDDRPAEIPERNWHHSSHELVHGLELHEEPLDTLPGALFDEFFKKKG